MSEARPIEVEVEGGIAVITLCRPQRLNAYTTEMGIALFGTIAELDDNDEVRAIIVTGAGRAFCAGADLGDGGSTFARSDRWVESAALEAKTRPWRLKTPVIAAINGPAVGIGATMILPWDIRIASDKARFGFVFVRRGIIPEAGSTWYLPRLVGFAAAADLMLTGRIISAREALELRLVSRVVPHDELMPTVMHIARDIAANTSPVAVGLTKRLLWQQLMRNDAAMAKDVEDEHFHFIGAQPDAAEGVESFLQRRAPQWKQGASALGDRGVPDDDVLK